MVPRELQVILFAGGLVLAGIAILITGLLEWSADTWWKALIGLGLTGVGVVALVGLARDDEAGYPPRRRR